MTLRIVAVDADTVGVWRAIHNTVIPVHPLSEDEVHERLTRNVLTLGYAGEQLVGNATIRPPVGPSSTATVIVRILPEHRRRGYGSAYLSELLAKASALGADRIETIVLAANQDGLAFALRRRFVELDRYLVDGAEYVELVLRD